MIGLDLLINENVVLIMAGGLGKRMNSELPKVLHLLKEKPLIVHVIETALKISDILWNNNMSLNEKYTKLKKEN